MRKHGVLHVALALSASLSSPLKCCKIAINHYPLPTDQEDGPSHSQTRDQIRPVHLHPSIETLVAYLHPIMRQYALVEPPTTTTWIDETGNLGIISSSLAFNHVA
jgi:hypothetical protein